MFARDLNDLSILGSITGDVEPVEETHTYQHGKEDGRYDRPYQFQLVAVSEIEGLTLFRVLVLKSEPKKRNLSDEEHQAGDGQRHPKHFVDLLSVIGSSRLSQQCSVEEHLITPPCTDQAQHKEGNEQEGVDSIVLFECLVLSLQHGDIFAGF